MSTTISTEQRRSWSVWVWLGLGTVAIVQLALSVAVDWFIAFGFSSCRKPIDVGEMHQGQLGFLAVLLVGAVPWALAALLRRDVWTRFAILGAVACLPALGYFLGGLDRSYWGNGFCF